MFLVGRAGAGCIDHVQEFFLRYVFSVRHNPIPHRVPTINVSGMALLN